MKNVNFPYAGFFLSWTFQGNGGGLYDDYSTTTGLVDQQVFDDITMTLKILNKYELLNPQYILDEKRNKRYFQSSDIDLIVNEIKQMVDDQLLLGEVGRIGGVGVVDLANGERVIQEDLVLLESIRFFERLITVATGKSIWIPISIDTTYDFDWQIELAKLNAPRLEKCLRELYSKLQLDVSPSPNEIDKDEAIWMKNFKLYVNPSILKREYELNPPEEPFDINEFLIA